MRHPSLTSMFMYTVQYSEYINFKHIFLMALTRFEGNSQNSRLRAKCLTTVLPNLFLINRNKLEQICFYRNKFEITLVPFTPFHLDTSYHFSFLFTSYIKFQFSYILMIFLI